MMFRCWIENEYKSKLELTDNPDYTVYQIDGLEPPQATINTSAVANFDGSRFNSSRTNERNIVIYLAIEGDCETNRINLYRFARAKKFIRFYYQNGSRDVYIDGYVESISIGFFEMKQAVQISIICPYPFFKSNNETVLDFTSVEPLFIFPFAYEAAGAPFSVLQAGAMQSLINGGDVENGLKIIIKATGQALNPRVLNVTTNEFFKINIEMTEGDQLTINTNKGQKSLTLFHDGTESNVINDMEVGSTWFQLYTGDNVFSYDADEFPENILCTFQHTNEFEGV